MKQVAIKYDRLRGGNAALRAGQRGRLSPAGRDGTGRQPTPPRRWPR